MRAHGAAHGREMIAVAGAAEFGVAARVRKLAERQFAQCLAQSFARPVYCAMLIGRSFAPQHRESKIQRAKFRCGETHGPGEMTGAHLHAFG